MIVKSVYEIAIISVSFLSAITVALYTIALGRLLHRRNHKLSRILLVIFCSSSVCLACLLREILLVSVLADAEFVGSMGFLTFNILLYIAPDLLIVSSITVMILSAAWSAKEVTNDMLLHPLLSERDGIPAVYTV
jgi:hypothetical protein